MREEDSLAYPDKILVNPADSAGLVLNPNPASFFLEYLERMIVLCRTEGAFRIFCSRTGSHVNVIFCDNGTADFI